jgi:hypothetical protein
MAAGNWQLAVRNPENNPESKFENKFHFELLAAKSQSPVASRQLHSPHFLALTEEPSRSLQPSRYF